MSNRTLLFATLTLLALIAAIVYWRQAHDIGPAEALSPSPSATATLAASVTPTPPAAGNDTGFPLTIPAGTRLEVFARDLTNARVIAFDSRGNMWVSRPSEGVVTLVELKDGKVLRQTTAFRGLRKPHGLAFDPDDPTMLYIAEEHRVSRVRVYALGELQKIVDLPSGGGHFTRTIGFGPAFAGASAGKPDKRLYVSIGSSCNVCIEKDTRRATIYSMKKDGTDFKEYARGLRNSVFFTWHPGSGKLWATEMGRDLLGDDLPPDEVNIIEEGKNYGWPICYGNNIHDAAFDKNVYIRNPCQEPTEIPNRIAIQAHSAPLGLAFVPSAGWTKDWQGDLLVAYHGSWNRSIPTGYKIVRFDLDQGGDRMLGSADFVTGWMTGKVYGRPVDIVVGPDNAFYISDDKAGLVYRLSYVGNGH